MGLYGQEECIYNEHHPNPYYLTRCNNPKIKRNNVESQFCNECTKAVLPEFNESDTLENLIAGLHGKEREIIKSYVLDVLKGYIQPWEVR